MNTERNPITAMYYPDKISAKEFFEIINDTKSQDTFIENMKNINLNEDKYPEDWLDYFSRWMELKGE